jgi:type IV pilus assembly protein PilE
MNRPRTRNDIMNRRRTVLGFTLIELLVTMVVASILVAIAVPSYSLMLRKSRRTDAKTALLDIAGLEERYYSTTYKYSVVPTDLGYAGSSWPAAGVTVGSGYYTVQLPTVVAASAAATTNGVTTNATPATFAVTAVPVPGTDQAKDTACASFTVTSAGTRTAQNSANADATSTCWQ